MSATGFSQVDTHAGYFVCLTDTSRYSAATNYQAITTTDVSQSSAGSTLPANTVLRDCGKFVTVVNSSGFHLAKYRLVSRVEAIDSEGNSEGYFYVKVWDSNGSGITIARTG